MLSMPPRVTRTFLATTAAAAVAVGISGCGGQAPAEPEPFVVGIQPDSTEQKLLGELYRVLLLSVGQPAVVEELEQSDTPATDAVRSGDADMAIACTGALLEQLNPQLAAEAVEDTTDSNLNSDTFSETVYKYAVASFPGTVMTVDPSPAEGCAAAGEKPGEGELPNNIIPVFNKGELNRGQVNRLNFVNRVLTTEELAEMVEEVDAGADVRDVMAQWLLQRTKVSVDTGNTRSEDEGDEGASDNVIEQPPV